MNKLIFFCLLLWLGFSCLSAPAFAQAEKKMPNKIRVVMETELGKVEVELSPTKAPLTVRNFLRYVDAGFYDGGIFHRTVTTKPDNQPDKQIKIDVIQASINNTKAKQGFAAIPLERTQKTGLKHEDGTISMARSEPDSATSDFFICLGAQPELDYGGKRNPDGQGFAAFGRVIKGMAVMRKIQAAPAQGQKLSPSIKILQVKRKP